MTMITIEKTWLLECFIYQCLAPRTWWINLDDHDGTNVTRWGLYTSTSADKTVTDECEWQRWNTLDFWRVMFRRLATRPWWKKEDDENGMYTTDMDDYQIRTNWANTKYDQMDNYQIRPNEQLSNTTKWTVTKYDQVDNYETGRNGQLSNSTKWAIFKYDQNEQLSKTTKWTIINYN